MRRRFFNTISAIGFILILYGVFTFDAKKYQFGGLTAVSNGFFLFVFGHLLAGAGKKK